ncbi:3803_t:CDS:2, partial [Scutellospora calospora]
KLLLLLTPTLQSLNNNIKDSNSSLEVKTDLPSSFLVRTALKVVKIDSNKLTEKSYKITSEKATNIAAQSKRESLLMLLAEYTNDVVINQNAHSIQSCKDSLWSLVTKLVELFKNQDLAKYDLFKGALGINEEGIKKILVCYKSGKLCLEAIFRQDMYKIKPCITSGRKEILYIQLNDPLASPITSQFQSLETPEAHISIDINRGQRRQRTTEVEKRILASLLEYRQSLPISMLMKKVEELNTVSSDWTVDRIRQYWNNNRTRNPN